MTLSGKDYTKKIIITKGNCDHSIELL